jgi:signal transduction histidine kinase
MNIHLVGFWFLQGFMLLQLIYILLQWRIFSLKDYKFYLLYLFSINFVMGLSFLMHYHSSNQLPILTKLEFYLFNPIAFCINIFYNYLSIHLLNLEERSPSIYKKIRRFNRLIFAEMGIELILLALGYDFAQRSIVMFVFVMINFGISFYLLLLLFRLRVKLVTYYAIGSISLTIGSCINNVLLAANMHDLFGILPIFYTLIGMFVECICFNLILNYKYILIEEEKRTTQLQLIEQLKESQQLIIEKQNIRNNIAKDLHDEIGSALTSINILSNVSKTVMEKDPKKAQQLMNRISEQTETVQQTVSDIVWAIKPDNDSLENMATRMREYISETLEVKQIPADIQFDEPVLSANLPMESRKDFLLIFKEAINNIIKHAGATHVNIALAMESGKLELVIKDNGAGINPEKKQTGNGLGNMKARAQALNGQLHISSEPGKGTELKLTIPIP